MSPRDKIELPVNTMKKNLFASFLFVITVIAGCAVITKDYDKLYGPVTLKNRMLAPEQVQRGGYVSFKHDVQPIINQRCVVCHSCYDAPCQLNMSSAEGIDRGSNAVPVYNGARFVTQEPTRLGIDANSTEQWRQKGFRPVLNERRENPQINLDNSLLYQMLALKRRNPLPDKGRLPAEYEVGTELRRDESFTHTEVCPTRENFDDFSYKHPYWGMPFAFPGLNNEEFKTIETWLEQGAKVEPVAQLSEAMQARVARWEVFLNGATNKQKLMSRYLYEHLFLGHLYFEDEQPNQYFMLVRSRTPPGEAIDVIASVRPYDAPGAEPFYYRLQRYDRAIVAKTHLPYALSDKRMVWLEELFLQPDYEVGEMPSYEAERSGNPFDIFAALPARSRYKFMLQDAGFFVGGFIKGPVCRGSIALSVIDDHFWVVFTDPDKDPLSADSEFLQSVSKDLRLPSEKEDDMKLLVTWLEYKNVARKYFFEKVNYMRQRFPGKRSYSLDYIWDGDNSNTNAALTVYRHFDSATVVKGFVGEVPKTGWVLDYPMFERIHYLLVAGFNVYGVAGHQLATRLYMDFLRMEAELQFLAFLPSSQRIPIYQHWYRGSKQAEKYAEFVHKNANEIREPDIEYKTDDVKTELFIKISRRLKEAQPVVDYINLCTLLLEKCEAAGLPEKATATQNSLRRLSDIGGEITDVFPNVTFLRIVVDGSLENDQVYTILRNKSYLNTTSLTVGENTRIKAEDTIDVVQGLVGAYPNFFLQINYDDLDLFVQEFLRIDSYEKYDALVERYGIRRTSPDFWKVSDWFYSKYRRDEPVEYGLFDLNRYQNR